MELSVPKRVFMPVHTITMEIDHVSTFKWRCWHALIFIKCCRTFQWDCKTTCLMATWTLNPHGSVSILACQSLGHVALYPLTGLDNDNTEGHWLKTESFSVARGHEKNNHSECKNVSTTFIVASCHWVEEESCKLRCRVIYQNMTWASITGVKATPELTGFGWQAQYPPPPTQAHLLPQKHEENHTPVQKSFYLFNKYSHIYTCVGVYIHVCAHMCLWRSEVNVGCLPQSFSTLCFHTGSPNEPRLH